MNAYRDAILNVTYEDASTGLVSFEVWARDLNRIAEHLALPLKIFPAFVAEGLKPRRTTSNVATEEDQLRCLIELLHERRHRKPLQRDLVLSDAGDPNATDRIVGTLRDYQQLRRGKLPTVSSGRMTGWRPSSRHSSITVLDRPTLPRKKTSGRMRRHPGLGPIL